MSDIRDEELMLAFQSGNASAFDMLYQRYRGRLFQFLVRESGSRERGEEIYQETWLKVIRARNDYQVKAAFSTWLYQIAHHSLIDYWRQQGRRNLYEFMPEEMPDAESCALNPEQEWGRQRSAHAIADCLRDLPAPQREVFLLKEDSGFSLAEIADIIGIDAEAAKSRLRYALKKLRLCLESFA